MPDPLDNSAERAKKFLRDDPFLDGGANPFVDPKGKGSDAPSSDNPFSTSTDAAEGIDRREYVTTQEPRSGMLLGLAAGGLLVCSLGVVAMLWRDIVPGGYNWFVVPYLALAACVPAVTLSYGDLLAMEAGAMSAEGTVAARTAFFLGLAGCLLTVAYTAGFALVILRVIDL